MDAFQIHKSSSISFFFISMMKAEEHSFVKHTQFGYLFQVVTMSYLFVVAVSRNDPPSGQVFFEISFTEFAYSIM